MEAHQRRYYELVHYFKAVHGRLLEVASRIDNQSDLYADCIAALDAVEAWQDKHFKRPSPEAANEGESLWEQIEYAFYDSSAPALFLFLEGEQW